MLVFFLFDHIRQKNDFEKQEKFPSMPKDYSLWSHKGKGGLPALHIVPVTYLACHSTHRKCLAKDSDFKTSSSHFHLRKMKCPYILNDLKKKNKKPFMICSYVVCSMNFLPKVKIKQPICGISSLSCYQLPSTGIIFRPTGQATKWQSPLDSLDTLSLGC